MVNLLEKKLLTNTKYLVNKDKNSKQAFHFIPTSAPGGAVKLGKIAS